MNITIRISILYLLLFWITTTYAQEKPYVIVLSMDGFRWDYPDSVATPNLKQIEQEGVRAQSLIPSFPSVTFPNHYTLATGLYPDHHGIVHNSFYSPELDASYKINDRSKVEDGRFYGGEPIWNTAEKQGVKSATFYWVGSEANIENMHPSYWKKFDASVSFENRIDTVIHWLTMSEAERPHLIMFYFDEPDHSGHLFGPNAPQTRNVVAHLDSLVGNLQQKLSQLPINKEINLIILADHGMGAISNNRRVNIDEYVKQSWIKRVNGHNPVYMIDANESCNDSIINTLQSVQHLKVWKKANVPSYLHFGTNARIGDIVVVADSSYSLAWKNTKTTNGGAHGYDIQNTDIHAIFYACGPAFKKAYKQPSFANVDVYSIIAHILNLTPAKTDGSLDKVKGMFRN